MTSADNELCFLPAAELAQRIRRRDLSPVEVTEAYLRRIEARNPVINAYTLVLGDEAMDAARVAEKEVMAGVPLGPLHGVPVGIKDLDDVADVPTSMASRAVHNRVPQTSAAAVERLLAADCAADRRYEGFYCASPTKVSKGTGGSANPVFIK